MYNYSSKSCGNFESAYDRKLMPSAHHEHYGFRKEMNNKTYQR